MHPYEAPRKLQAWPLTISQLVKSVEQIAAELA